MPRTVRCAALLGVCGAMLLPASGAFAQAAPATANESTAIEQIVVTAQKRSENIREVPISITAVTGAQLAQAGVATTLDLTSMVPGLKMDRVGNFSDPAIRGISTLVTEPGSDPNVATYVDGIYQANATTGTLDLPDVSQIDVLKGPQGTLFGRNATGGAILVSTLDPTSVTTGRFSASYGSFNDQSVKGYISGPLSDKLFASVSAYEETADSYYHDVSPLPGKLEGVTSYSARLKLLYEPSSSTKITLNAFFGVRDDPSATEGTPFNGNSASNGVPGAVVPTKPYDVASYRQQYANTRYEAISLKGVTETSQGTLTMLTSYQKSDSSSVTDATGAYDPNGGTYYIGLGPDSSAAVELNFASKTMGPFSYIAGLNYFHNSDAFDPLQVAVDGTVYYSIYGKVTTDAYAAFSELTYHLTDALSVVAGGRYSYEKRALYGNTFLGPENASTPPGGWLKDDSRGFSAFTPRASLRYKIEENTNAYFTFSQGFKSGTFNSSATPLAGSNGPVGSVNPEKITAYELGLKSQPVSWWTVNASVFYYDYSNQQVNAYETVCLGPNNTNCAPLGVINNAASSTIYGLDLETTARPIPELTLRGGLSLLHAKYDAYPGAGIDSITPGNLGVTNTPSPTGAGAVGNNLERAPKWTLNLSATYAVQTELGRLTLNGNLYHSDTVYYDVANIFKQAPYTTLGGEIGFKPANTNWSISVYGRNLTNKTVILGAFLQENGATFAYAAPRNYGVKIGYDF